MEETQTKSPLREEQLWLLTGGILMIAFVAFSFAMYFTRSFMIPFVFSVFLCAMVSPVDNWVVNRLKLPRWVGFVSCMLVIVFLFLCIIFVGKYAIGSINDALQDVDIKFPTVEPPVPSPVGPNVLEIVPDAIPFPGASLPPARPLEEMKISPSSSENTDINSTIPNESVQTEAIQESVKEPNPEKVSQTTEINKEVQNTAVNQESMAIPQEEAFSSENVKAQNQSVSQSFEKNFDYWLQKIGLDSEYVNAKMFISSVYSYIPTILRGSIATCQTFISFSTMVLLYSLFILMGRNPKLHINNEVYNEVEFSIQKYLNIKFFISLATGICIYIIFLCIGTPMAFLFGLLAFVLNFIPSIGSIIATILPLPIIMLTMDISHTGLFLAFFLPCLVQNFLGNFLDPKMQGEGLQLHPVTILLALGYWGVVWGIFGMLLAAPMTAALRIILLEFKTTHWIAQLMGGKIPTMKEVLEIKE